MSDFKKWFNEHDEDETLRHEYKNYLDSLLHYDIEPVTFPRWLQLKYEAEHKHELVEAEN